MYIFFISTYLPIRMQSLSATNNRVLAIKFINEIERLSLIAWIT